MTIRSNLRSSWRRYGLAPLCPRGAGEQRVTIGRRTRHTGRSDGGIRSHLVLDDDAAIEGGFETVVNDMTRCMTSVPLPGAKPITIVTGRSGYAPAFAAGANSAAHAIAKRLIQTRVGVR